MLILGSVAVWPAPARAQAPQPPAPPSSSAPTQPAQPAADLATAPDTAPSDDNSVGSVATLQGGASVTRNSKAASALKLSDPILKGDVLETGANGTLGVTFDDDTTFNLTPNSRISVDDFLYKDGDAGNTAVFNIISGKVAFAASQLAKSGSMKIETPTASLGIRGTTGVIEIPAGGANGEVAIKLYPDADGRLGRIEVFGRDGAQLGTLTRGATGFAIRPGAAGAAQRFTAVPLTISLQEATRDRAFVRQTFATQFAGRRINTQRRTQQQQQRNQQQRNQQQRNQQQQRQNQLRPNQQRPNQLQRPQTPQRPGQQTRPGLGQRPGLLQRLAPGSRPGLPGARPGQQRRPGLAPGQQQKKPPPKKKTQTPSR